MRFNEVSFFDGKHAVKEIDNVIQPYDGSLLYNIHLPASKIVFTSSNDEHVSWSGSVATFTHSMNCYPIVLVYDASGEQVYPTVTILSGTSFSADFETGSCPVKGSETWTCVIVFGVAYGDGGSSHSDADPVLSPIPYEGGSTTIPGSYRQEITTIPATTSAYELSEGVFNHAPAFIPTYSFPEVTDGDVTHEILLTVRFSSTALSYEFVDANGNTIVPSTTPAIQAGSVVVFRCTYESLLGNWAVLPIPIGTYATA